MDVCLEAPLLGTKRKIGVQPKTDRAAKRAARRPRKLIFTAKSFFVDEFGRHWYPDIPDKTTRNHGAKWIVFVPSMKRARERGIIPIPKPALYDRHQLVWRSNQIGSYPPDDLARTLRIEVTRVLFGGGVLTGSVPRCGNVWVKYI